MRGRERARKKHITRAGWRIIAERTDPEHRAHSLRLRSPAGEEVEVGASSRPRAYLAAETTVASKQRETRASSTVGAAVG